ncbi:MAG: hypothetical protein M3R71_02420 [Actinomycetota bacterium]|nr:hypothetical protein [Actinomycetota bacterium]
MIPTFPVMEINRVMRRTLGSAAGVGIVGVGIALLIGQPLAAPGLVVGLVLAVANHRVFQASASRFITPEGTVSRKPFTGSVALRLGACTAIALLGLIFVEPFGWGVVGGLVIFQILLLLNSIVALLIYQRSHLDGSGVADA